MLELLFHSFYYKVLPGIEITPVRSGIGSVPLPYHLGHGGCNEIYKISSSN